MQITGLDLGDFELITSTVGNVLFDGNLRVHQDATAYDGIRCRARVCVYDSHGSGARTSASGRHGPFACWHAYRDVLAEVFQRYPDAVIRTGMAYYRGRAGFARHYPATGDRNIGSQINPITMPECCDCHHGPAVNMTGWAELPIRRHSHRTERGARLCPDCRVDYETAPMMSDDPALHLHPAARRYPLAPAASYAETLTRIDDVLDGLEPWEREVTLAQYRKDAQ